METASNSEIYKLLDEYKPEGDPESLSLFPLPLVLQENQVGWGCDLCGKILQQRSKFYHKPLLKDSIDHCADCFGEIESKKEYEYIDTENNYLYSLNNENISIISLGGVPESERKGDGRVALSKGGTEEWLESIGNIYYNPINFGSLRRWAAISDLYEIPFLPVDTFFLFDTVDNRIALCLINKHGYLALKIVYQSVDEYIQARGLWEQIEIPEKEFAETLKLVREGLRNNSCDKEDLLKMVKEFSGHVALMDKLTLEVIENYVTFGKVV